MIVTKDTDENQISTTMTKVAVYPCGEVVIFQEDRSGRPLLNKLTRMFVTDSHNAHSRHTYYHDSALIRERLAGPAKCQLVNILPFKLMRRVRLSV